jgi:hypothetical protein
LETVQAHSPHFFHLGSNGVLPISCQAISAGTHKEVRLQFTRGTEQFINIAFPVTYMHAPFRVSKQAG